MFKDETTIVVGAGASREVEMPIGDALKLRIVTRLAMTMDNAYRFVDPALQEFGRIKVADDFFRVGEVLGPYWAAAARIVRGLPLALSIDNYIHTHNQDPYVVELGKLAIGLEILAAEQGSAMLRKPTDNQYYRRTPPREIVPATDAAYTGTWYLPFAQQLFSGVERNVLGKIFRRTRFIIFNYDRCLEHYLWLALQDYFDLTPGEAALVLEPVTFIHPYGSLGRLPWQPNDGSDAIDIGFVDGADYQAIAGRIRTFTETLDSAVEVNIQQAMSLASTVIFLGFGFVDQNMLLLKPRDTSKISRVLATTCGLSDSDRQIVHYTLERLAIGTRAKVIIEPETCTMLLRNNHLQLTLS
jgi:hypothetical protein